MKCYYHPEVEAVATCSNCGKAICQTDVVDVAGKIVCKECLATGKVSQASKPGKSAQTNSLAIISLALAALGVIGCCCFPISGIFFGAISGITGYMARKQVLESKGVQQGLQLATLGMVLGIGEAVLGIIWIVFFAGLYGAGTFLDYLQQYSQ